MIRWEDFVGFRHERYHKDQIEELFIVMVYCTYSQHVTLSTLSLTWLLRIFSGWFVRPLADCLPKTCASICLLTRWSIFLVLFQYCQICTWSFEFITDRIATW